MNYVWLNDLNSPCFQQVLAIYHTSFPAHERQSDEIIRQRITRGFYQLLISQDSTGVILFALIHAIPESNFILLDYLALRPDQRGNGLGSQFLQHLIFLATTQNKTLLLETENPDFGDNRYERRRRLNFYRQHGAKELLGISYKMPPLCGTTATEMLLLVAPANLPSLPGKTVSQLITNLFTELYQRSFVLSSCQED